MEDKLPPLELKEFPQFVLGTPPFTILIAFVTSLTRFLLLLLVRADECHCALKATVCHMADPDDSYEVARFVHVQS